MSRTPNGSSPSSSPETNAPRTEERRYEFRGRPVTLELWPDRVFVPTTTSEEILKVMEVLPGETVIDFGCGSGLFGVAAALGGAGKVIGTDINPEAAALATRNAARNGVEKVARFLQGNLWEPLQGVVADRIVDDVSGVPEELARVSGWFPGETPAGGPDGTGPTLRMLEGVREHLKPGGILYLPMLSLSHRPRMIEAARKIFEKVEKAAGRLFPLNDALKGADGGPLPELQRLVKEGIAELTKKGSRLCWECEVYVCS